VTHVYAGMSRTVSSIDYKSVVFKFIQSLLDELRETRGNGLIVSPKKSTRILSSILRTDRQVPQPVRAIVYEFMRCLEREGLVRVHKCGSRTTYFIPKTSLNKLSDINYLNEVFERCGNET